MLFIIKMITIEYKNKDTGRYMSISYPPTWKMIYPIAYRLAVKNTNYNKEGKATVSSYDEWADETEWDELFKEMKKDRGM